MIVSILRGNSIYCNLYEHAARWTRRMQTAHIAIDAATLLFGWLVTSVHCCQTAGRICTWYGG